MTQSTVKTIKNAKKAALLFREFSQLFLRLTLDDKRIEGAFISRVDLSNDGGICYVYFYSPQGEDQFQQIMPYLILYKPSLRKALSQRLTGRYTPDLVFRFDAKFEKLSKLESLLDSIKTEEEPS